MPIASACMSLEQEVNDLIRRSRGTTPALLEYALTGQEVEIDMVGGLQFFAAWLAGLEEAVQRLARELDARSS